jgi:hypothetical protein
VVKGWLKKRCGLEPRTNFFPFKKSPKTECGLDSDADYIREHTVYSMTEFMCTLSFETCNDIFDDNDNKAVFNSFLKIFLRISYSSFLIKN